MKTLRVIWCAFLIAACFFPNRAPAREKSISRTIFSTAESAAEALGAAYDGGDPKAIAGILGDRGFKLVASGDPVIDRHERQWFLSLYREKHEVIFEDDARAVVLLGKDEYPYPIPIVRKGKGWRFDPSEGHEDLLSRRIGKAELSALDMVVACVHAQRAYLRQDHDGDGVFEYAQRFRSSSNRHDGLYWKENPGDAPSPTAAIEDIRAKEGYGPSGEENIMIYRGYFYKMLKAQGPHAPGGACEYIVDGKMTRGFALAAFPVRYGVSGVLTFIVNKEGVIYQKDLGPRTVALGNKMRAFDPDKSWIRGQQN